MNAFNDNITQECTTQQPNKRDILDVGLPFCLNPFNIIEWQNQFIKFTNIKVLTSFWRLNSALVNYRPFLFILMSNLMLPLSYSCLLVKVINKWCLLRFEEIPYLIFPICDPGWAPKLQHFDFSRNMPMRHFEICKAILRTESAAVHPGKSVLCKSDPTKLQLVGGRHPEWNILYYWG